MMNSNEDFAQYLGVDYEKKYGYIRICCPEHNDTHPSLLIYPEIDRGAYCFVCHKRYNWAWLAHLIKGIDYKQALKDLGQEHLTGSGQQRVYVEETTFCEERERIYIDAYNEKFDRCSTDYPEKMVKWLENKKLLKVAKELDWRWHDGRIFKGWREGIVIPHRKLWTGKDIDYVRIREWNGEGFDKPKGSFSMTIEPYFSTFRPNSVQFLVEGESDAASIYAHGGSAIGLPGATAKKAMNTVLATLNDLDFVKSVIVCGDNDESGQEMNKLVMEAGKKIAPRLVIRPFKHSLDENKADINDEHTKGLLRLPVQFTSNYRGNYDRQPWANQDLIDAVKMIEDAEANGATWVKQGNIEVLSNTLPEEKPKSEDERLAELPIVEVFEPRYHDRTVLVAKYHISGSPNNFLIQITKGAMAGFYEATPECVSHGWDEKMKSKNGQPIPMLVLRFDELKKVG